MPDVPDTTPLCDLTPEIFKRDAYEARYENGRLGLLNDTYPTYVHSSDGLMLREVYGGEWRDGTSPAPMTPGYLRSSGGETVLVNRPHGTVIERLAVDASHPLALVEVGETMGLNGYRPGYIDADGAWRLEGSERLVITAETARSRCS